MNNRRQILVVLLVLFILLVSGCVSFPGPKTENDAILLFPMAIEKDRDSKIFGRFRLTLQRQGAEGSRTVYFKPGKDYQTLRGLSADRYTIIESAFQYESGKIGHAVKMDLTVDLNPSSITILGGILTYMAWFEDNTFYMSSKWQKLTQEKATEILTRLQKHGAFETWSLSPATTKMAPVAKAMSELGLR